MNENFDALLKDAELLFNEEMVSVRGGAKESAACSACCKLLFGGGAGISE